MLTSPKFDPTIQPETKADFFRKIKGLHGLWTWRDLLKEDADFIQRMLNANVPIENLWDVGASNGTWAWAVGRFLPKFHYDLFEPLAVHDKGYFEILQHQLSHHDNWTYHPVALGPNDSEATIHIDAYAHNASFLSSGKREGVRELTVPVRQGDQMLAEGLVKQPHVVKMDVQGFELSVMEGMTAALETVKALHLETWLTRGYGKDTPLFKEVHDWVEARDFVLVEVGDGFKDGQGSQIAVNAWFVKREVAVALGYML